MPTYLLSKTTLEISPFRRLWRSRGEFIFWILLILFAGNEIIW